MNARLYSPELGRFISADSMVPDPEQWEDYNRYAYARNNPMRYRDPSGHNSEELEAPPPPPEAPSYVLPTVQVQANQVNNDAMLNNQMNYLSNMSFSFGW